MSRTCTDKTGARNNTAWNVALNPESAIWKLLFILLSRVGPERVRTLGDSLAFPERRKETERPRARFLCHMT